MILSPRFGLFFKGLPVIFQLIIRTQCNWDLMLEIIFSLNITVRCCGLKICNIMKDRWGTISNMHKIWWLDPCRMLGLEQKYLILNNNLIRFNILLGQWSMWSWKFSHKFPPRPGSWLLDGVFLQLQSKKNKIYLVYCNIRQRNAANLLTSEKPANVKPCFFL